MDQTRFNTVEVAAEINRQLTLDSQLRATEGNSFALELQVPISYGDTVEDGTFTLIVDRVTDASAYRHANDDVIYATEARVVSEGEPFKISITIPEEGQHIQGACVHVAKDMERIILEYLEQRDKAS